MQWGPTWRRKPAAMSTVRLGPWEAGVGAVRTAMLDWILCAMSFIPCISFSCSCWAWAHVEAWSSNLSPAWADEFWISRRMLLRSCSWEAERSAEEAARDAVDAVLFERAACRAAISAACFSTLSASLLLDPSAKDKARGAWQMKRKRQGKGTLANEAQKSRAVSALQVPWLGRVGLPLWVVDPPIVVVPTQSQCAL